MINKFFTNPGRFIKTFFAITAIVFFAWGGVEVHHAHAAELSSFLNDVDGVIPEKYVLIEQQGANINGVNLKVSIMPGNIKEPPKDTGTKPGELDDEDDLGDFWDAILDSGIGDSTDGIYLVIKNKKTGNETSFEVPQNAGYQSILSGGLFSNAKNITKSFWQKPSLFFDQYTFGSVIGVTGLESGTEYVAEIIFEEDKSTDSLVSKSKAIFKTTDTDSGIIINTQATSTQATGPSNAGDAGVPNCGVTDFYCSFIKVVVIIITLIPNLVAAIVGVVTDVFMNLSIGHNAYQFFEKASFEGWKIIRDFSNILIILALFYAAFSLILGGGDDESNAFNRFGDPKKVIVHTIIVALFINFSFFFSRVIIDAGNVSSRFIYNQISAEGVTFWQAVLGTEKGEQAAKEDPSSQSIKPITLAMLSQVQPQKLLTGDSGFSKLNYDTLHAYLVGGFLTFLFDLILIYIFLTMLFLFAGRIIILNLLTIFSALAFATVSIPKLRSQKYLGFDDWLKQLVGNAFLGLVFFFFIYLSAMFSKIDINAITSNNGITGFLGAAVGMLFKAAIIFGTLFYGKKIAIDWSGAIGELVSKAAGYASNLAIGAATGGTALIARQTLGALGSTVANNVSGSNVLSRGIRSMGNRLGAASFDVRNSPQVMSRFNQATNALGGGTIPVGDALQRQGGFIAEGTLAEQYRRRQEEIEKRKIAEREATAASLAQNQQARTERETRELQSQRDLAAQEVENKKAEIENSAYRNTITNKALEKHQNTIDDVDKYDERTADLEFREREARYDGSYASKKADFDKERLELDKKKEKAEKGYDKAMAAIALLTVEHKDKNLDELNNEIAKLQAQAKNSPQARDKDKAKEDADESKKKATEAETELKNFKKRLEALKTAYNKKKPEDRTEEEKKIIDDMSVQQTDLEKTLREKQAENTKNQAEFKDAEKKYNEAFGDKIKTLENAVKDSVKSTKKDRQGEIDLLQEKVTKLDVEIIDKRFQSNQTNSSRRQNYADNLSSTSSGRITSTIGTITNGGVFGGRVRNANNAAATSIRNTIRGGNRPPTTPPAAS
jgi:hypothetical protein